MMENWLIQNQIWCRIIVFFIFFALLAWWETRVPWRSWLIERSLRWTRHFSLALISLLLVRLFFPLLAIGTAVIVQNKGIGWLNQSHFSYVGKMILGVIFMDLVIYFQHRMMHRYQFLWRVHRVHHIDKQVDVSTGIRFHPIEEIIIMGMKILGITFFGVPPLAVFIYEILLSFAFLYTHLNIRLLPSTEKILRYIIVTPGMHRIHHSDFYKETNSNYGFCFSGWDRLFGSYRTKSLSGERKLLFGLEEYRDEKYQTLENLLLLPFNVKNLKIRPRKIRATKFKSFEK